MFSLNQIRELFYLHLHRSEIKQTIEVAHEERMNKLKYEIELVDNKIPPVKELIYTEKKGVTDIIDAMKTDENQFRLRYNLEIVDITSKIQLLIKEMKSSLQMVKLGEKQIDAITEKMDTFRTENFKFKNNMKTKFYDMDKRFNDIKATVDTEVYRLKSKVEG